MKISALFRVSQDSWPHSDLDMRLVELLRAFGAHRLMWGTDYPFVEQNGGYNNALTALDHWKETQQLLTPEQRHSLFRGTAEFLFGEWPS